MKFKVNIIIIFALLFSQRSPAQENSNITIGNGFSLMPKVIYISSATVQLFPFSNNQFERSFTEELSGGYGYGISFRKKFLRDDFYAL